MRNEVMFVRISACIFSLLHFCAFQPCLAAVPGGTVGAKVVVPPLADRPRLILVESVFVNFIIHHGEGESMGEGSLVVSAYKDDKSSTLPVDAWLAGLVLRRDGEIFDATIVSSADGSEDLILIVYIKEKGMINAMVFHYVPEGHSLALLRVLDDLRNRNLAEAVRVRCARFPDLIKYFEVAKVEKK